MTMPKLDVPNVSGKTVDTIALHDDVANGREVTIRFTDGTELSVVVATRQVATVRHFEIKTDKTLYECNETAL